MLQRSPNYMYRNIAGVHYLLPFGQAVVNFQRAIKINETGVWIWNALETPKKKETVICDFLKDYEIEKASENEIVQDVESYLGILIGFGMLIDEEECPRINDAVTRYYKIGLVTMKIIGLESMISEKFDPYTLSAPESCDLVIDIQIAQTKKIEQGKLLIRNEEVFILENETYFFFRFYKMPGITEAFLEKATGKVILYAETLYHQEIAESGFHVIRFFYLYEAWKKGCFALHSASILYRDKVWMFAGPSGMGKSTHTALWHQLFDAPYVNGDLNLLAIQEGKVVVYGTPWCGTSEITDASFYTVGGIILLQKEKEDYIEELAEDEKIRMVCQRLISPIWLSEMLESQIDFLEQAIPILQICRLHCTKDKHAAVVMKRWIDQSY